MTRFLISSALVLLAGCASKQTFSNTNSSVTSNPAIEITTLWLKDKGKKYDIEMNIRNVSSSDIVFFLKDMSCEKGGVAGRLKHTFFNTGERSIDFRKGQLKRFKMVCDIGAEERGSYKIMISQVFENPNGDGRTQGKVLATNVSWTGQSGR